MFEQLTSQMDFMSSALKLRAQRQQLIAGNIANADTPGFIARDFDFAKALRSATAGQPASAALNGVRTASLAMPSGSGGPLAGDDPRHLHTISSTQGVNDQTRVGYSVQTEPSADGNSVDMDQQRANFVDNAIRYESTLRFINSHVKTMMSAIQGQ